MLYALLLRCAEQCSKCHLLGVTTSWYLIDVLFLAEVEMRCYSDTTRLAAPVGHR